MNELGQLIQDIGFPVVAALLMFYLLRQVLNQLAQAETMRTDAEKAREKANADREARDDDERRSFMKLLADSYEQNNRAIASIGQVAEAVRALAENSGRLADEQEESNRIALEDRDAAAVSRQNIQTHMQGTNQALATIKTQVSENFTLINGVNRTLLEIYQRLRNLQSQIPDADVSAKIDTLQTGFNDLRDMIAEKKKSTDENPAIEPGGVPK